jgi:serine/threonine protein kinase
MAEKVATTYINRKLSPGDVVLGQYKIIKEIARGGMNSIIYLAEDTRVKSDDYFALENKNVAVKIIAKNETVNESD